MSPKPKPPKVPLPPRSLGDEGKAYWKKIQSEFDVPEHQFDLLAAACQQLDRAAEAREKIACEGVTALDRFGQAKTHPAVDIERNAHLAFCRLQRELGLDIAPPSSRPPARPGTRN
jgi:P27 family predicted phage terminase small subunit